MRRTDAKRRGCRSGRLVAALAVIAVAGLAGSGCKPIKGGGQSGVWLPTFTGTARAGILSAVVDLQGNLGLDKEPLAYSAEVYGQILKFRVKASGWAFTTDGVAAGLPFLFDDQPFSGSVFTDLELMHGSVIFEFALLNNMAPAKVLGVGLPSKIYLGLGFGANVLDVDMTVTDLTFAVTGRINETLPYPVVSASLEITPIKQLTVHASISGIALFDLIDEVKGHVFDARVGVRYNVHKTNGHLAIGAQYHIWDLDAEISVDLETNSIDATAHGFSLYVMGKF